MLSHNYNQQAGIRRLTTETSAGQWGSSRALAGQMLAIEVRVYMVRVSKELEDYEYPQEAVEEALHHLPKVAQV